MRTIRKKCLPEFFQAVLDGKKKYELRLNEFDVQEGDIFVLEEIDPVTRSYTGRTLEKRVTYAWKFTLDDLYWPKEDILEKGLVIMSLE
jgi:hypothetical protein